MIAHLGKIRFLVLQLVGLLLPLFMRTGVPDHRKAKASGNSMVGRVLRMARRGISLQGGLVTSGLVPVLAIQLGM